MHVLEPAEVVERLREERVRVPVVERDVGRRPQHDERRAPDRRPKRLEHERVGLEVGEVVLLLQCPGTGASFGGTDAVAARAARAGSSRARPPSSPRGSRAGAAASPTRSRTSSSSGCRGGAPSASARASRARARGRSRGPSPSRRSAPSRVRHLPRLLEPRAAAVVPDHRVAVEPVAARAAAASARTARAVISTSSPRAAQQRDERPEDERRARDAVMSIQTLTPTHAPPCAAGADACGGACSTWRSCQSVNASSPQSWRDSPRVPATWSSSDPRRRPPGRRSPAAAASRGERLAGERLQLAAQPGGGRDREAALAPVHDLVRQQRLDRLPQQHLLREPAHLVPRRQREREVRRPPGRGTARAPRATGPSRRGRSSRAGRRRGRRRSRRPAAAPAVGALGLARSARGRASTGSKPCRRPVSSARASAEKISFQPWWRSSGGRCAARTKRFAL